MKTRALIIGCILCATVALATSAHAVDDDADWDVLRHLTHRKTLTFWLTSNVCVEGQIRNVTAQNVDIESAKSQRTTLQRKDILRVGDSQRNDFDILYLARNSWLDVEKLHSVNETGETVRVTTKQRMKFQGEVSSVTDSEIVLKTSRKASDITKLARQDVALVEYVRFKPASDDATFWMNDGVFLTPETWIYGIGLGPKIVVRIYDATQLEDNRPTDCKPQR